MGHVKTVIDFYNYLLDNVDVYDRVENSVVVECFKYSRHCYAYKFFDGGDPVYYASYFKVRIDKETSLFFKHKYSIEFEFDKGCGIGDQGDVSFTIYARNNTFSKDVSLVLEFKTMKKTFNLENDNALYLIQRGMNNDVEAIYEYSKKLYGVSDDDL